MTESCYYWNENYRTKGGKTLQQCLDEYGIGTQNLRNNGRMEVIFLDARRDFSHSWTFRCYNSTTGVDIPIAAYEKDRQRGPCPKRVVRLNIQN